MTEAREPTGTPTGTPTGSPIGTINVVDPHPLNWLYITYNTVEELVRADRDGLIEAAAMEAFRWTDEGRTLEVDVRGGEVFPDGEPLTAETVKRAFEEVMLWAAPHPPGTQFNLQPGTTCEVDGTTVRFRFPEPDGLALGKLRAMHVMSTAFWEGPGFGYERQGSGEGHW